MTVVVSEGIGGFGRGCSDCLHQWPPCLQTLFWCLSVNIDGGAKSGSRTVLTKRRTAPVNQIIHYEPDERCPPLMSIGVGVQGVMLVLAPTVLIVAITAQAAGQGERYLSWAVFAALIIGGVLTVLQAGRVGRLGAGHVLITSSTPKFIAISVVALAEGGPAMLASLIVIASLFQFALAAWLPLLRRIITPVVSGTVLMLIAATVLPVAFDRFQEVPEGAPLVAGPTVAVATLLVAASLALRASGAWRLWTSLIGIGAGCAIAALFGLYDVQRVIDAPWAGIPMSVLPGFDATAGAGFWALLPVFVVVTLVVGLKTIGDSVAIQHVSRRRPRATDFRLVQGALNVNGLGVLLSGIAGTPPTTVYSSSTVSLINLTGVAARSVGYAVGAILLGLAFLPKLTAILLSIPSPVMGAYLLILMGMLFVEGVRSVVQSGLDYQKALVVGLAFAIGVGLENQNIFADLLGGTWGVLLGNGMTVGSLVAILMTLFMELTSPRRRRLEVELDISALAEIDAFLHEIASRIRWNDASTERLRSAGEETLSSLLQPGNDHAADSAPRLIINARPEGGTVEMEFLAVFEEENLEDRLAYLGEQAETLDEREISFRLLRHYASSVRHQKYHGIDIVTVQVEGSR